MNKLMKMATVVVGVGAMLSFAGCGEQDPAKKAANTFREINAALISSGLADKGLVDESDVASLENGTIKEEYKKIAIEQAQKLAPSVDLFKKYLAGMKEIKSLDSEMYKDANRECDYEKFLKMSVDEQKKFIDEIQKNITKFKAMLSGNK